MIDPTESTAPSEPTEVREPGSRRRTDSPPASNRSRDSYVVRSVIQSVRRELGERWRQRTEEQRQDASPDTIMTETQEAQRFDISGEASYGPTRPPPTNSRSDQGWPPAVRPTLRRSDGKTDEQVRAEEEAILAAQPGRMSYESEVIEPNASRGN